jgi:3-hydroxybutyryl-CoA dehydrogenase
MDRAGKLKEPMEAVEARIEGLGDLAALSNASIVIEAINEDKELKQGIFSQLDELVDETSVLASNTSSVPITALAGSTNRPDRVVGIHFMNPAPIMPLVEIVQGELTSAATMERAGQVVESLGKTAVIAADRPGFIVNRLLAPMLNEAVFALMEGVGTRDDIDKSMKLGTRHPMGPLELADLIGLDVLLALMDVLHQEFADSKYRPCPLLRRMVESGKLGRKSGVGFYDYS